MNSPTHTHSKEEGVDISPDQRRGVVHNEERGGFAREGEGELRISRPVGVVEEKV